MDLRNTHGMTKAQGILNHWAIGADGTAGSLEPDSFQVSDPIKKHLETFHQYFPNASEADLRSNISGVLMGGVTTKKAFYDYLLIMIVRNIICLIRPAISHS